MKAGNRKYRQVIMNHLRPEILERIRNEEN